MEQNIEYRDLGIIDYKEAWDYQEKLLALMVSNKTKHHLQQQPNYLLFCQHPHVYTLGKSGTESNLLINSDFLNSIGATYYRINRGGDITYHGPGQLVGYPIIDLEQYDLTVKKYVYLLESSIIELLAEYNILGTHLDEATGVWVKSNENNKIEKICAIGVRISRYVTMHGFALNVNTDLNYFNHINPCGFTDKGVTSMAKIISKPIDIDIIKQNLSRIIIKAFGSALAHKEAK